MTKTAKKVFSILLVLLMMMPVAVLTASAADSTPGIVSFALNGLGEERFSVSWWKSDLNGKYYAFMPADADLSSLAVTFDASHDVTVGGTTLTSGQTTSAFSSEGEYTLTCNSESYTLVVMKSANLPAIYIETESGSLDYVHADKDNKEKAEIAIVQEGEITVDTELSYIKGRGNSTWKWAKKPYNIKFDKKIDLFGMGKAKKWSLLASYNDVSLLRNKVVFDFAEELGLMYSSKSQHVDLYINGEYQGNYLLCESVELGSTRIDIDDLDEANEEANDGIDIESLPLMGDINGSVGSMKWVDIPTDPADITGGYLIEMEFIKRYAPEASGFITTGGQPVVVKSPEYASKAQVEYISGFYQEFEEAVMSETGYNSLGKYYSDYMDISSAVKMYLLEEFTMDIDVGKSSTYFYKEAGTDTKLIASPVWDFDYSLGNGMSKDGIRSDNPEIWFAALSFTRASDTLSGSVLPTVFTYLMRHDDFYNAVCEEWASTFKPLMVEFQTKVQSLVAELRASALMNVARWADDKEIDTLEDYQAGCKEDTDLVTGFMEKRLTALDKAFGADSARLHFNLNGGTGIHNNYFIATVGEAVEIQSAINIVAPEGTILSGWNTEPDGSGVTYRAGDEIVLRARETTLYAQWRESKLLSALEKLLNRFMKYIARVIEIIRSLISVSEA